MSNYRRSKTAGACYFFTVVTYRRRKIFLLQENVDLLREVFMKTKIERPFKIEAIAILSDHLHCLWRLPQDDTDFPSRWREIKKYVTKRIGTTRNSRKEGNVWQRRFWEHQIRDEQDWRNHMDYIHYNPVKHGYASAPREWKWSSFNRWVNKGGYEPGWGANGILSNIEGMEMD